MIAKVNSATLHGIEARIVKIEVDVSNGLPAMNIVGLAGISIRESKERIRSCLRSCSLVYPIARLSINLSPADLVKSGTQFDLGIAIGVLIASEQVRVSCENCAFFGELSLDGKIHSVRGSIAMVIAAKESGIKKVFVSTADAEQVRTVEGLEIYAFERFIELVTALSQGNALPLSPRSLAVSRNKARNFQDVIGQGFAKRGFEIAAAGGHNLLISGPPGSGKTMLAEAFLSILPEPSLTEAQEILKIQNVYGISSIPVCRPIRSPHHFVSLPAFAGGGIVPRPGEISLAHRGVLFLDEFPEFKREVLESLRQPMENGVINIPRLNYNFAMPAKFILIAAQNPCPCGYAGDLEKKCTCTAKEILSYQRKISGPILDRIDLRVSVKRVRLDQAGRSESSEQVFERVKQARQIQVKRYGRLNAEAEPQKYKKEFRLHADASQLLTQADDKYSFSMRGYFKVLKISRTIADLAAAAEIQNVHVAEALQYRTS